MQEELGVERVSEVDRFALMTRAFSHLMPGQLVDCRHSPRRVASGMSLELRISCERCNAPLTPIDIAFICSYECTFCAKCTEEMQHACPNCGGELVRRPRRLAAAACTLP